jgi:hypothetical protein
LLALTIRISRLQAEVADLKIADPKSWRSMWRKSREHGGWKRSLKKKERERDTQLRERRLVSEANSLLRSS